MICVEQGTMASRTRLTGIVFDLALALPSYIPASCSICLAVVCKCLREMGHPAHNDATHTPNATDTGGASRPRHTDEATARDNAADSSVLYVLRIIHTHSRNICEEAQCRPINAAKQQTVDVSAAKERATALQTCRLEEHTLAWRDVTQCVHSWRGTAV